MGQSNFHDVYRQLYELAMIFRDSSLNLRSFEITPDVPHDVWRWLSENPTKSWFKPSWIRHDHCFCMIEAIVN